MVVAIRADAEIPERRMTMTWSLQRNADPNLPASHTADITFTVPQDFLFVCVSNVPGIMMKQAERHRGTPLADLAIKIAAGVFLIDCPRSTPTASATCSS